LRFAYERHDGADGLPAIAIAGRQDSSFLRSRTFVLRCLLTLAFHFGQTQLCIAIFLNGEAIEVH
jgi:hypothetical protein